MEMEGKREKRREIPLPFPLPPNAMAELETLAVLPEGNRAMTKPPFPLPPNAQYAIAEPETLAVLPEENLAVTKPPTERPEEDPSCRAAAVVESHVGTVLAGPVAFPADIPGAATAGARKRKAPATVGRPRKPKLQDQPIQMPVYYGHREDFNCVRGEDLSKGIGDDLFVDEAECKHVICELLPQPWLMSLVDLKLLIFKLFRLHPETQDLAVKGFFKQHTTDLFDEEDLSWCLEYIQWDEHYFVSDKCWRSFANKLKRRRKVVPKFMLYVQSSEIKHYDILLKAVHDNYSVVLPQKECLTAGRVNFRFVEDLAMTPAELVARLSFAYGKQMSPPEAWRGRQYALEREFGTFYESHNIAPRLLKSIVGKNRGGFVDIKDEEVAGCKDFLVLRRIFWAFAQCLQAFQHCRPVLCVKGMALCGKYQGVLLTALAFDANGYSIPVACAVVEADTKESWLWFLRNLERAVLKRYDVCLMHDYKLEVINAVEEVMKHPQRPCIWKDSQWCLEHLAENFMAHFGDKKLMMMFKKLCEQRRLHKFRKMWKELDELTSKYMADKESAAIREMLQEAVEHNESKLEAQSPCNQPDSLEDGVGGDHADGSKRKIMNFSDWICLKPMEKWSLLHDKGGARYGIMGSNIVDVYKHDPVLKGITCLLLSAIVEVTFKRMVEYFKNTSAAANQTIGNPSKNFPEHVQDDMNSAMQKAEMHRVVYIETLDRNVPGSEDDIKYTVHTRALKQRRVLVHLSSEYTHIMNTSDGSKIRKIATCSCKKPQLLRKPCSHVIAVCCVYGIDSGIYMSLYYSLTYLGSTWRAKFNVSETSRDYKNFMTFQGETTWIPDKRLECGIPAFVPSECVQTALGDEEQQCSD